MERITMTRDLFNELEYQGLRVIDNCGRNKKSFGIIHKCEKSFDNFRKCQCHQQSLYDLFIAIWGVSLDRGKKSEESIEGYKLLDSFNDKDFYVKHLNNNECIVYCPNILVSGE